MPTRYFPGLQRIQPEVLMLEDRRQPPEIKEISAELLQLGKAQLESEIRILDSWLQQLDETRKDNLESLSARKTYSDMLESRKELLESLKKYR
jgi:hypothetical protein